MGGVHLVKADTSMKYQGEISCNYQSTLKKKKKDRKIKLFLSGDVYQWEEGGNKERVNEGEYGGCILYSCVKIEY
jgi:hypothetical protein